MQVRRHLRTLAHLTAALLLCAAAPVTAQANVLGSGGGSFFAANQQYRWFAFQCIELPNGEVTGHAVAVEPATQSLLIMDISSAMLVDGHLAMAGTVQLATNEAPFEVGQTTFFVVDDDPSGDRFAGVGAVPPMFGSMTIQQIVALIGPPPPQAFAPLLLGNVNVF